MNIRSPNIQSGSRNLSTRTCLWFNNIFICHSIIYLKQVSNIIRKRYWHAPYNMWFDFNGSEPYNVSRINNLLGDVLHLRQCRCINPCESFIVKLNSDHRQLTWPLSCCQTPFAHCRIFGWKCYIYLGFCDPCCIHFIIPWLRINVRLGWTKEICVWHLLKCNDSLSKLHIKLWHEPCMKSFNHIIILSYLCVSFGWLVLWPYNWYQWPTLQSSAWGNWINHYGNLHLTKTQWSELVWHKSHALWWFIQKCTLRINTSATHNLDVHSIFDQKIDNEN